MPGSFLLRDTSALRAVEARAQAQSGDAFGLMQRAGADAWRELLRHWPQAQRIVVACGPGNNGGDGYVLARHALDAGRSICVMRLSEHGPKSPLAQRACDEYLRAGGTVVTFAGQLPDADVVVDALFGIGLSRAPDAASRALIAQINAQAAPVLALDVSSGLDADRGSAPGACVRATRTLEFIAPKRGLRTGAALDHGGVLSLATLDVDPAWLQAAPPAAELLQAQDLARWLGRRPRDAHKGQHGRVLCVGGDHGSGGAIILCAQAALRSGAGLVDVATRRGHVAPLLSRVPEAMVHVPTPRSPLSDWIERADVIAIGPGLGQGPWGSQLLHQVMASGRSLVLDADALNLVSAGGTAVPAGSILTPHPGEAARLLGLDTQQVQRDRFGAAHALAERFDCVVVLKGAGTVVSAPGQVPRVLAAGNSGMAVGGMGDVLTGVISALRAQSLSAFDAACAGALLHAAAGDVAARAGERGLLPSDLMPWLHRLANPDAVP